MSLKDLYSSGVTAREFNATNALNNEFSYAELEEFLIGNEDDGDDYTSSDESVSVGYDDKVSRRELLDNQRDHGHKSQFEIEAENLRILAELKAGYKNSRMAFSNLMVTERALTSAKFPTLHQHYLELFPRLSRVPMSALFAFKADFKTGFNSGLSSRIAARPDRSSIDPSLKNMQNFHKWILSVDLEAVQREMVVPARLSVLKVRSKRVKHKNAHIVVSDLNGNQGEFTGPDDLAAHNALSKRNMREAYSFKRSKNPDACHKPQVPKRRPPMNVPQEPIDTDFDDLSLETFSVSEAMKALTVEPLVLQLLADGFVFSAKVMCYEKRFIIVNHIGEGLADVYCTVVNFDPNIHWFPKDFNPKFGCGTVVDVHGYHWPCVPHGMPGRGRIDNGSYYMQVHAKAEDSLLVPFITCFSPFGSVVINGHSYLIFVPLYQYLQIKFISYSCTDQEIRLIKNNSLNQFSSYKMPVDLLLHTVDIYLLAKNTVPSLTISSEQRIKAATLVDRGFISEYSCAEMSRFILSGVSFSARNGRRGGKVIQKDHFFADFNIVDGVPTEMQYEKSTRMEILDPKNVFDFKLMRFKNNGNGGKQWYTSTYFSICGDSPNVFYSIDNRNLSSALSRPFKCVGGSLASDIAFRERQLLHWEGVLDFMDSRGARQGRDDIIDTILLRSKHTQRSMARMLYHSADSFRDHLGEYNAQVALWQTNPEDFRSWYVSLPHPKRGEREHANEAYKKLSPMQYSFNVEFKLKKEIAKHLKAARLYVTYSEYGVFIPWFFEMLKKRFSGLWDCHGNRFDSIVRPHSPNSKELFPRLWDYIYNRKPRRSYVRVELNPTPESKLFAFREAYEVFTGQHGEVFLAVIFGDDAFNVWFDGERGSVCNTDISSCDCCIGMGIFNGISSLIEMCCGGEFSQLWMRQHTKAGILRNPNAPDECVKIRPADGEINLGSGTTATTFAGSVGNVSICLEVMNLFEHSNPGYSLLAGDFMSCASKVGFVTTVSEISAIFESIQFLKCSPYYAEGAIWYATNRAVFFRGFGNVDCSLKNTQFGMTQKEFNSIYLTQEGEVALAESFFSSIIAGLVHEPACPILLALRERFPKRKLVCKPSDSLDHKCMAGEDYPPVPMDFYLKRYNISPYEMEHLVDVIIKLQLGDFVIDNAVSKLLNVDYDAGNTVI